MPCPLAHFSRPARVTSVLGRGLQVSQAAYIKFIYVTSYVKLGQTLMFRYCQHHCHALVDWLDSVAELLPIPELVPSL